jgi:hypothetical protein
MYKAPKNIYVVTFLLTMVVTLYGCLKAEVYPDEPVIEFKSFEQMGDSGKVMFTFTDGDGDIGLDEADTVAPYNSASKFYNNVFIRYYEKVNGAWQQGVGSAGPVEFTYRTEKLTPSGKNKALKGTIIIYLVPIFYNPASSNSDTIKYDIQMADRSLHLSNMVETGEFVRE